MNEVSPISLTKKKPFSTSGLRLLTLSNGHGEDVIAVRILQELQQQPNAPEIFALPLVGEGRAFQKLDIPIIGSVRSMPSGGFIYQDGKQLARDVRSGLLQLTINQFKAIRRWVKIQSKSGYSAKILAVGDIVPLLFAWLSGSNYAFVGTAKSEYYLRDEAGWLKRDTLAASWEGWSGSDYLPWERWLMSRSRCKSVFPRDSLTTEILKQWKIPAFDLGNPMMDGLEPSFPLQTFYNTDTRQQEIERPLAITLLPGSRIPEAYTNWDKIAIAVSNLIAMFRQQDFIGHTSGKILFLAGIAPGLDCNILTETLKIQGWHLLPNESSPVHIPDPQALTFKQKNAWMILTQNNYNDCLHLGDLAIAMAGTATEQFVGLGKPAIIIPGDGPQFTPAFAEAQSRLLGCSVILAKQPKDVASQVKALFANPDKLHAIAKNGVRRMGKPGAAKRIAECLLTVNSEQ
ncbi:MAG: lipid-A-disaccharide synthase-related protein [Cyanobacteria bacterium P01_D01_bin.50]